MPWKSAALLTAAVFHLAVGLMVYLKGPKRPVNRTFGALAVILFGWCLANALGKLSVGVEIGFLVARFAFVVGSLVPCALLAFTLVFPEDRVDASTRRWLRAAYLVGAAFSLLSFTPFIFREVVLKPWGLAPVYGVGFRLLLLYFIAFLGFSIVILARKLARSPGGSERLRLQYFFLALGVSGAVMLIFTVVFTLITGTNRLVYLGPLSTVPMVALIAYAIVRYRLMEIEIAFQRGLVYLGLVAVLSVLFFVLDWTLGYVFAPHFLAADLIAFLSLVLLLPLLIRKVEGAVGYLLPWGPPDYSRILREFGQNLTGILAPRGLQVLVVKAIVEVIQPKHASLWLLEGGKGDRYGRVTAYPDEAPTGGAAGLEANHHLCRRLRETGQVLVREELARQLEPEELQELEGGFEALSAGLLVPLFSRGELYGILALAEKRSRKIYSDEDVQFLSAIGNQVAIALNNAALYNEIRVARDHYGMLLKHMDNGVVAVDSNGTIITVNPKAEEVLQMRREEVLGRKATVLGKALAGPLEEALNGRSFSHREVLLTTPPVFANSPSESPCKEPFPQPVGGLGAGAGQRPTNKSVGRYDPGLIPTDKSVGASCLSREEGGRMGIQEVFLSLSASPLLDWEERQVGALLVFSDLTEKKRLEEEVQRTQRLASLGAMAGRVAHEIRNPLVAVKTFCQVLPERHQDVEFIASFSPLVHKEVNRINAIVDQLLDLSRFSPLALRPTDLHRVLEETLTLFQNELAEKNGQIIRRFCDERVTFLGDEGKFKQVLLNLLLNSLQAMEDQGVVTIATGIGHSSEVNGRTWPDPENSGTMELWVQIEDTGCGIPPEHLPSLFDPFFTTKERGSGLGLFICQDIIKEFKGRIEIESEVGRGTTVTLRMPSTPPE